MFRGIHAEAKNQWLDIVDSNMGLLTALPNTMDRLQLLRSCAKTVRGIGETSVWETLLYIESMLN